MNDFKKIYFPFNMALIFALLVLLPGSAQAQEPVALELLTVRIWAEFDQPNALVIMEGEVTGDTPLPTEVQIPLPPGAEVNAVAYPDPSTLQLMSGEYEQQGDTLIVQVPNGIFWLEYYDPGLTIEGDTRNYNLTWTTPSNINRLEWWVQTPYAGRNLEVEPNEGGTTQTDQFNLPNFVVTEQNISDGDTLSLSFSYTKTDETLTATWLESQAPAEAPAPAAAPEPQPANEGPPTWLTIVLLAVGLLLVGGGVYWFVQQSQSSRPRKRPTGVRGRVGGGAGKKFCTECGERIQSGDKFCRSCGARL